MDVTIIDRSLLYREIIEKNIKFLEFRGNSITNCRLKRRQELMLKEDAQEGKYYQHHNREYCLKKKYSSQAGIKEEITY